MRAVTLRHAASGIYSLSALLVALSLLGCPGNLDPSLLPPGSGTGTGGGGASSGSGGTGGSGAGSGGAPPPCDPAPIFKTHLCANTGCHDAMGTSANFDMSSSDWQTRLVGVNPKGGGSLPSKCGDLGAPYLKPGAMPASGLFLDKLRADGTPPCGEVMPIVTAKLMSMEVDCIQSWANSLVAKGTTTPTDGGSMSAGDGGTK
jgi:hypothetical protein